MMCGRRVVRASAASRVLRSHESKATKERGDQRDGEEEGAWVKCCKLRGNLGRGKQERN